MVRRYHHHALYFYFLELKSPLQLDPESQPHLENHLPGWLPDRLDILQHSNSHCVLALVPLFRVDEELHFLVGSVSPIRLLIVSNTTHFQVN